MFPSWSQHIQGWTCSRDVILETSVHWIFGQFQAKGFKPTGNKREFLQASHFCCSLSMTGGFAPSELHHEEKHFISVHLWRPLIQHEPPFTFGQLTALVKMSDVAMTDEYRIAIMFIFNWFFSDCCLFSTHYQASVLWVRQRGMFSFKECRRKRLPCLPVTLEYKELLCLYGRGSKGSVS